MLDFRSRCVRAAVGLALLLSGCSAGTPDTGPSTPPASPSTAPVSIPADGIPLASVGVRYGPVERFSIPRSSMITVRVDQPNAVTLAFVAPAPAELLAYLRRALPAAGFRITADNPTGPALTLEGLGWRGSVTAAGATSALVLRPL